MFKWKVETYLDGFLMGFLSKVENWKHLLFLGQWDRQVEERIKGDGHLNSKGKRMWVSHHCHKAPCLLQRRASCGELLCFTLEHVGQTSLDLNWPWKRSTMKESFLILCLCHASSATTCTDRQKSVSPEWECSKNGGLKLSLKKKEGQVTKKKKKHSPHPDVRLSRRSRCTVCSGCGSSPRGAHPARKPWTPEHHAGHSL